MRTIRTHPKDIGLRARAWHSRQAVKLAANPFGHAGAGAARRERVMEANYSFALNKWFTLTADYQFIANPAYNADRGPVHVFSGRLHGEF